MTKPNIEAARAKFKAEITDDIKREVAAGVLDATNASKATEQRLSQIEEQLKTIAAGMRSHDLPGSESETHNGEGYSFRKVILGLSTGSIERVAPMEFAMSEALFAQGTVPDSAGGFIVPMQVMEDQIIPLLQPMLISDALGVQEMPLEGFGVVGLPREKTEPTVSNVAENSGTTTTSVEFGNMQLEPHTAQVYIESSRRFLQMGRGAETFIRNSMAKNLAKKMNLWLLKGTGADGDPIGVLNAQGVNAISFSGVASGGKVLPEFYRRLVAMEDAVADANAIEGASRLGWAVANRFLRACRIVESDNNTAGTSNLEMARKVVSSGANPTILEYPYAKTTQLASGNPTEAIFGDWDQIVMAMWNNLTLDSSNHTESAMRKRQTHIVAYMDMDVAVMQPTAFAVATSCDLSSLPVPA